MSLFKFIVFILLVFIIRRFLLNLKNLRLVIRTMPRGPMSGPHYRPTNSSSNASNASTKDDAIEAEYKIISQKPFQDDFTK